jgi:hypothetical protein
MTRASVSTVVGCVLASLVLAPTAYAQVDVPVPKTDEGETKTRVWAGYEHMFNTDINNGGQIQRDSLLLGLSREFELGDSTKLVTNVTYQLDSYDWSKGAKNGGKNDRTGGGFRWSEIHTPQLVGLLNFKLNDNWSLIGAGLVRMSAESGANLDDAVTYAAGAGFMWAADDKKLRLGMLGAVLTEIEDEATFAVLPLVHWRFAEDWMFELDTRRTGAIGYGPEIIWTPGDSMELALGAAYQQRRFRLDNHTTKNTGGDTRIKNGVGKDTSVPVYARLGFIPAENMLLDLYAGVYATGRVRVARKGGGKLRNADYDPTPMIGAKFEYKF